MLDQGQHRVDGLITVVNCDETVSYLPQVFHIEMCNTPKRPYSTTWVNFTVIGNAS